MRLKKDPKEIPYYVQGVCPNMTETIVKGTTQSVQTIAVLCLENELKYFPPT